jgi:hypothetical protein
MKLKCNYCGEIVESGLVSVGTHVMVDCKSAVTKKVSPNFSFTYRKPASFTPFEELPIEEQRQWHNAQIRQQIEDFIKKSEEINSWITKEYLNPDVAKTTPDTKNTKQPNN